MAILEISEIFNFLSKDKEVKPIKYLAENEDYLNKIDALVESHEITEKEKRDVYRGRYAVYPVFPVECFGPVMSAVASGVLIEKFLPESRCRLIMPEPLSLSQRLIYEEMPVSYVMGIDLE